MLSRAGAPLGAALAQAAVRAALPGAGAGLLSAARNGSGGGGSGSAPLAQPQQRCGVASSAAAAAAAAAPPAVARGSVLEIREYTLHPAGVKPYLKLTAEHADLRRSLLPFLGMFTCDTGGELNVVTHLYAYESMAAREEARAAAAKDAQWVAYVDAGRQHMQKQASRITLEATGLYAATGAPGAAAFTAPSGAPGTYELRQYQLHPGYGSVPKLLKAFEEGLPDKIAADPEGRLVSFAYSDVGTLNSVVELWRYPSAAACIRARQAARQVPKWRETIAAVTPGVQTFTTSFLTPCSFSPWQ